MIKLIASDADGTLTEHASNALSDGVVKGINSAIASGISFAVVSGRDYLSLKKLFFGVADGVYYVSCNGALCVKDGKALYSRPVAREGVIWALSDADMLSKAANRYAATDKLAEAADAVRVYSPKEFFEYI